jgi:cellulose synthase catalytic subunit (UDP-forming)
MESTVTRSLLWREFESADSIQMRVLRFSVLTGGVLFFCFTGVLSLNWPQQLILAVMTILLAVWMDRGSSSYPVTLTLMLLSLYSTFRYGFWRISTVLAFFRNPGTHWTALDAFFVWMLLLAECYAFVVLLLGYMQMLWPLGRKPVPLPDDLEQWPAVDVLIPTLNEPLSVVRFTALAAMNIDWPADKLNVYILDDGHREEFRAFAEEAGIGYMTRDDNQHAKAGNINHALAQIGSPFVAVFDSDHVPTRSFLQVTMGWFLRDRKLGLMQTPHHFYSPDPFERNLGQFRVAPNEGELFYGIVQDGNDFWNAAFFCGSCAVIRRAALDEVGGIAVETVTEDAHTSLRMQMRGWNTAYINIPQAAGLATERLSGHVRQRIRWARGMVQVLRIENPLFAPGLKPAQRLCYFNAMSHFLYALPRLIFLTAPLIYLLFGRVNIPGYWLTIMAYAAPHLVLSNLTNSRVQGRHRHSFWNEIYETVLAPYIFLPTVLALFSTRTGSFNVTAKGGVVSHEYFDARIARPFLVLLGFDLFGLLCAIPRAVQFPVFNVTRWLRFLNWPASIYDGGHPGTIFMNVLWLLFSVVLLGVATAVARESRQRRQSVRITKAVPSDILLPDGYMAQGITCNLSNGGVQARIHGLIHAGVGDPVRFVFPLLDGTATLPATVVAIEEEVLRAKFNSLNLQETEALAMILYSRADTWLGPREAREADHPMRSLGRILRLSLYGLSQTIGSLLGNPWKSNKRSVAKGGLAASVVPVLLLGVLAGVSTRDARGAQAARVPSSVPRTAPVAATRPRAVAAARDDDNLNLLPRPFYDPAAGLHPAVPIVFLSPPTPKAMRAAGIVASWFGILTDDHPVRFPVSIGTIPDGNAIVIAEKAREIPASLGLTEVSAPTLALRANPSGPKSKLLLVTGGNADDLVKAAIGLALECDLLQGGQVSFAGLKMPGPRQPDDAPRWLSTERNTEIGEIAKTGDLQSDGTAPVSVFMRLPPDLYYGQTQNLAFHLNYRYNGVPLGSQSTLQVTMNGAFVSSTPMPHTNNASQVLETVVPIPVVDMRPFSNTLRLQFAFQRAKLAEGEEAAPANLEGAVLKDSTLDIEGIPHWAVLPNLELFANAGYPFTRLADLSETTVVLPERPSAGEMEVFLDLMGHFGAQTGTPVLNVGVTDAAGMSGDGRKDYLVLGTVDDQPALRTVDPALPVGVDETGLHIRDAQGFFHRSGNAWWRVRSSDHVQPGELETVGGLPDALIEAAEWPRGSARTVVVVLLRDPAASANFAAAFLENSQSSAISQTVSVLRGTRFSSYRIGSGVYRVGNIPLLARAAMVLTEFPWLIVLVVAIFSFPMAALIWAMVRRRARARLQGSD